MYLDLLAEAIKQEPEGECHSRCRGLEHTNMVTVLHEFPFPDSTFYNREFLVAEADAVQHAFRGALRRWGTPIEHIAVSESIGLVNLETGPKFGSNHLPVIARLTIGSNPQSVRGPLD